MTDAPRRAPDRPPDEGARRAVERLVRELPAEGRVPRRGGDLAFAAPWEVRALGMAVELHRQGRFPWTAFQSRLAAAIGEWEAAPSGEAGDWSYYRTWVQALEGLVTAERLLHPDEIEARTSEFLGGARDPKHH